MHIFLIKIYNMSLLYVLDMLSSSSWKQYFALSIMTQKSLKVNIKLNFEIYSQESSNSKLMSSILNYIFKMICKPNQLFMLLSICIK